MVLVGLLVLGFLVLLVTNPSLALYILFSILSGGGAVAGAAAAVLGRRRVFRRRGSLREVVDASWIHDGGTGTPCTGGH